jgi:hypothetical protein
VFRRKQIIAKVLAGMRDRRGLRVWPKQFYFEHEGSLTEKKNGSHLIRLAIVRFRRIA